MTNRAKAEARAKVWIMTKLGTTSDRREWVDSLADLILNVEKEERRGRCDCLFEGERGHEKRIHCCQLHAEIELHLLEKVAEGKVRLSIDEALKLKVAERNAEVKSVVKDVRYNLHLPAAPEVACNEILRRLGLEK